MLLTRLSACSRGVIMAASSVSSSAAASTRRLFSVVAMSPPNLRLLLPAAAGVAGLPTGGRRLATTTAALMSAARAGNSQDAKLSSLLDSELRYEKSAAADGQRHSQRLQAPQPPEGFTITARDGTRFTLTKKCSDDGSLLEVSFDLNGSTSSQQDDADDLGEDQEAEGYAEGRKTEEEAGEAGDEEDDEIQARPDLTFRVRKPGSQTCLAVHCSFPPVRVSRQMASEDPDYPSLSIDTLAVEGASAELGDYELEADMLNDDLYKQLAEMLVQRGVTRHFENSLVEFCTAQEHQLYLRFLAEAKKFCDA